MRAAPHINSISERGNIQREDSKLHRTHTQQTQQWRATNQAKLHQERNSRLKNNTSGQAEIAASSNDLLSNISSTPQNKNLQIHAQHYYTSNSTKEKKSYSPNSLDRLSKHSTKSTAKNKNSGWAKNLTNKSKQQQ